MGIIKTGLAIGMIAVAFYGGYKLNEKPDYRFVVEKKQSIYYLLDKKQDKKKEIMKNFELGTIEERLDGLLEESKDSLKRSLDNILKPYTKKNEEGKKW